MMLTLRDQVVIAFKVISDSDVDSLRVADVLELLAQFLRLAIVIMGPVVSIVNVLDEIAVEFWRGWDAFIIGLRWQLCPIPVAPIG